ncbi:MAG: hypothetical protein J7M40_13565 [Planctomycetes bacterium]|nr:hypothetical protein [Planctomycetota bacterium]
MADQVKLQKEKSPLSGWFMIIPWAAMIIFAFHSITHMVGAGDTWVAMACGRHFLNHGVDTVEPFSAYSHKAGPTQQDIEKWPQPAKWLAETVGLKTVRAIHPTGWINQNWLTHVIFYKLATWLGSEENPHYNALVYWKIAVYILTIICVYYIGRIMKVNPPLAAAFACFALFVGRTFFDVRPAGFSNLLTAVFILILTIATYRNILYIWLLVPLAVFWGNVHGGYIYLFIMLVPYFGLNFITSFFKNKFVSIGPRGLKHTFAAGMVSFIAVAVFNPYHLTNFTHTFIISISKQAAQWRTVNEWHPAFEWDNPVGTSFTFLVFLFMFIGLLACWLLSYTLRPKLKQAPRSEMLRQKKYFSLFSKTIAAIATVFVFWTILSSFSLLSIHPASLAFAAGLALILLFSAYWGTYFVYLTVPLTMIALFTANPDTGHPGYMGRYLYPLFILPGFVILSFIAERINPEKKLDPIKLLHAAVAAAASFLLMLWIVDIDSSKFADYSQLLALKRVFRPRYEHNISINYSYLSPGLYIVNSLAVAAYLIKDILVSLYRFEPAPPTKLPRQTEYTPPRIDLALVAIAALTIYMAIRSRRFIPLAAIAACPFMAMFLEQAVRAFSAARNFHLNNRYIESAMPQYLKKTLAVTGAVIVVGLGTFWSLKFKHIYLDPWPTDRHFTSVFMRMTASDAKPFYACEFIRKNNLSGKMFNYWTEGGFIAWGQDPDPKTGKTPLQLFMDGRAQAAYQRPAYNEWARISYGGPIAARLIQRADLNNSELSKEDYEKIGAWINSQLKKHNVWVVLMPKKEFDKQFVRGLWHNPDWEVVFFNREQRLFVDITTKKGRDLKRKVRNEEAHFPDQYHRNLIVGHNLLYFDGTKEAKERGYKMAVDAFNENPCYTSIRSILYAGRFEYLQSKAAKLLENFANDFSENEEEYYHKDGYFLQSQAATNAYSFLRSVAARNNNKSLASLYSKRIEEVFEKSKTCVNSKRW